jgi:hypothetical protein
MLLTIAVAVVSSTVLLLTSARVLMVSATVKSIEGYCLRFLASQFLSIRRAEDVSSTVADTISTTRIVGSTVAVMLSDTEVNFARSFDDPTLTVTINDVATATCTATVRKMTDDQLQRIEACEQFFPNLPPKRSGRKTAMSLVQLREWTSDMLKRYVALRSADAEKVVLKFEVANDSLKSRS